MDDDDSRRRREGYARRRLARASFSPVGAGCTPAIRKAGPSRRHEQSCASRWRATQTHPYKRSRTAQTLAQAPNGKAGALDRARVELCASVRSASRRVSLDPAAGAISRPWAPPRFARAGMCRPRLLDRSQPPGCQSVVPFRRGRGWGRGRSPGAGGRACRRCT